MFSGDVRLFSKLSDNSKTTAESSTLFMEHILNGSSVSFSRQVLVVLHDIDFRQRFSDICQLGHSRTQTTVGMP